ncbi:MAG: hypothetical protein MjAS7_2012 [Metallosphaera javensis (ex Sakai et al. 2022)]|nr:MAG: hypothetical protein MjAS7_2012 [Metallosphaera javensis (ex Sakai et al. 2022)]
MEGFKPSKDLYKPVFAQANKLPLNEFQTLKGSLQTHIIIPLYLKALLCFKPSKDLYKLQVLSPD